MKKKICKRWKDVLEIFGIGNSLEFFFCQRLKEMDCANFFFVEMINVELKEKGCEIKTI